MRLQRLEQNDAGTYGLLLTDDEREVCHTLELPWQNNAPRISCIPAGTYTCRRRWSNHFKLEVFEITGVPGRSDILMHPANYTRELLGCVALGTSFVDLNGDGVNDLASSRVAFTAFMKMMNGVQSFTLTVSDPPPVAS
jgi:hypothetical protein